MIFLLHESSVRHDQPPFKSGRERGKFLSEMRQSNRLRSDSRGEMIVEPDFLDHWKTRLLIELTKNPAAPLMILRLWSHCQQRKKWKFDGLEHSHLRAICHTDMDGGLLETALIDAKFVEKVGNILIVHDWDKSNRYLISAWKNGNKGGRNPITDRKPTGNHSANRQTTVPSSLFYLSNLSTERVRERFKEWISVRKAQGKAPKDWDKMFEEQSKWLKPFPEPAQFEIISASIRNNWQGLHPLKAGVTLSIEPKEGDTFEENGQKYCWSKSGGKLQKMKIV